MVQIKNQLVSDTPYKHGTSNKKMYVTVHETDNNNNGAGAQAHANLQSNGNARAAAWHWQVDDKIAIKSFDHKFSLWAGGDSRGNGNMNSIHVEICVNADSNYKKACQNAAELVKKIMKDEGIPVSNVVQHNHWSGKNCPSKMRRGNAGVTWSSFLSMVDGVKVVKPEETQTGSNQITNTPKPSKPTSNWTDKSGNWTGNTLKQGHKGSQVKQLQELLASNHYYPDKGAKNNGVDGYYGANTEDAVRRYQSMHGLSVDGIAGKATYNSLKGSKSSSKTKSSGLSNSTYKAVKPYPSGSGVKAVQEALAANHYYPNKGAKNNGIDGVYGPKTADAVKRYQSMHGLTADGIYGPATRKKLQG